MIEGKRSCIIFCPSCLWFKEIEMEGPVSEEHAPDISKARYISEGVIRTHAGTKEVFEGEECHPILIPDDGPPVRFEYEKGEIGEFVV